MKRIGVLNKLVLQQLVARIEALCHTFLTLISALKSFNFFHAKNKQHIHACDQGKINGDFMHKNIIKKLILDQIIMLYNECLYILPETRTKDNIHSTFYKSQERVNNHIQSKSSSERKSKIMMPNGLTSVGCSSSWTSTLYHWSKKNQMSIFNCSYSIGSSWTSTLYYWLKLNFTVKIPLLHTRKTTENKYEQFTHDRNKVKTNMNNSHMMK